MYVCNFTFEFDLYSELLFLFNFYIFIIFPKVVKAPGPQKVGSNATALMPMFIAKVLFLVLKSGRPNLFFYGRCWVVQTLLACT